MSNNKYNQLLSKGLLSSLNNTDIESGKIRFTTDSEELYIDTEDKRIKISDFVTGFTESDILGIIAPLPKIYISSDTNELYFYNNEWVKVTKNVYEAIENLDLSKNFIYSDTDIQSSEINEKIVINADSLNGFSDNDFVKRVSPRVSGLVNEAISHVQGGMMYFEPSVNNEYTPTPSKIINRTIFDIYYKNYLRIYTSYENEDERGVILDFDELLPGKLEETKIITSANLKNYTNIKVPDNINTNGTLYIYIDNINGLDTNDGLTINTPKKTIDNTLLNEYTDNILEIYFVLLSDYTGNICLFNSNKLVSIVATKEDVASNNLPNIYGYLSFFDINITLSNINIIFDDYPLEIYYSNTSYLKNVSISSKSICACFVSSTLHIAACNFESLFEQKEGYAAIEAQTSNIKFLYYEDSDGNIINTSINSTDIGMCAISCNIFFNDSVKIKYGTKKILDFFNTPYASVIFNRGVLSRFDDTLNYSKPSGTYSGNADSSERKIKIKGNGKLLMIDSPENTIIVSSKGAFVFGEDNTNISSAEINFTSNFLYITSDNSLINKSGVTYEYKLL